MNALRLLVRNEMSLPARSSKMNVTPPAVPTPGMAGGGESKRLGFRQAASSALRWLRMAAAFSSGFLRSATV